MTKKDLIFDWRKSESSGKDKVLSVIIVGLLFAFFMGTIELSLPSYQGDSEAQGSQMRLVDEEMAESWALVAEENGPFPGRLETGADLGGGMLSAEGGLVSWTDYELKLRPIREDNGVGRVEITPKGKREFPTVRAIAAVVQEEGQVKVPSRSVPILIPYDTAALEWLPSELPVFALPEGLEVAPDSLRFAIRLRESGRVAEAISLEGGADPAQDALELWLRGVRFKEGRGERWFGLRVDFVNRRDDGSELK